MPNIETIALILGILIVVARLPLVFWPKKFISFWKRKFSGMSSARIVGVISLLSGLIFIYYVWNEVSLIQLLVGGFSILMLVMGMIIFVITKFPSAILNMLENKLSLVRTMAFIAILNASSRNLRTSVRG